MKTQKMRLEWLEKKIEPYQIILHKIKSNWEDSTTREPINDTETRVRNLSYSNTGQISVHHSKRCIEYKTVQPHMKMFWEALNYLPQSSEGRYDPGGSFLIYSTTGGRQDTTREKFEERLKYWISRWSDDVKTWGHQSSIDKLKFLQDMLAEHQTTPYADRWVKR